MFFICYFILQDSSDNTSLGKNSSDSSKLLIINHKLQAVSFAPDNLSINYGSKEDDDRALDMLSDLLTYIHKTRDLFASEIIKSLEMFAKVC